MRVRVAAVGPAAQVGLVPGIFEGPGFEDQGYELPFEARKYVDLDAADDDTLASVIDRAAAEFGLRLPAKGIRTGQTISSMIDGVALYKPEDDFPTTSPGPWQRYLVAVDGDGHVYFGTPDAVNLADLQRAYSHGLQGDPARIYFYPTVPQGGEIATGLWSAVLDGWHALFPVIEGVGATYGSCRRCKVSGERLGGWTRSLRSPPTWKSAAYTRCKLAVSWLKDG